MKRITLTLVLLLTITCAHVYAQQKVSASDLKGDWKLVIDIDEAFDEAKNELDEDEEILGSILLSSVSGLVNGILDNVDIYFEFANDGSAIITVDAFGETETEYSKWKITNGGKLYIDDSGDTFSTDKDSYWMFKNNILVNYDEDGEPNSVYLVKIQ